MEAALGLVSKHDPGPSSAHNNLGILNHSAHSWIKILPSLTDIWVAAVAKEARSTSKERGHFSNWVTGSSYHL